MAHDEHIGDGVYVSWDGYHIWLAANHHENRTVALEFPVFMSLVHYAGKHFDPEAYADRLESIAASWRERAEARRKIDPDAEFDSSKEFGDNGEASF